MCYEGLRNHETSRVSEQTSARNICRIYHVPEMAEATNITHWNFWFFFLNIWALSSISAFYCNTSTRETRLMQMLCQGFQSHLYWFTTLNNTTVTVRHRRTKAFFWGRWFAVGLDQGVEELEPSEGFLPSSIQSVSSSETYQWLMTALRRALHQPLLELIFLLLLGIRHHSWWSV